MFIKKLELLNFQVIKELNADFEGNVYFVTGDNELGKSTILKAIGIMLTGERDDVLKIGEDKGFAKMVVGGDGQEYEIDLKFTKANPRGTLSIKSENGMKSDNVTMLQKILGYQDFDAVEFSRWSETAEGRRKQVNVVKSLLPESVQKRIQEIDSEIEATKLARKEVNAELKTYSTICANAQKELKSGDVEKYAQPIKIDDLIEEQNLNAQLIEKAKTVRASLAQRVQQLEEIPTRLSQAQTDYQNQINALVDSDKEAESEYNRIVSEAKERFNKVIQANNQKRDEALKLKEEILDKIQNEKADFYQRKLNAQNWLNDYEEKNIETADTATRLKESEEHNRIHAKVVDFLDKSEKKKQVEKKVQVHENNLVKLASEREKLINDSKLPIDGLTFTDEGLELNGVPFFAGKVSDSQIMEIAAKLIIASNPTVKVFRIARGESLGQKRLESIIEIAQKNGFQGFIEQVQRGQGYIEIEEYSEYQESQVKLLKKSKRGN